MVLWHSKRPFTCATASQLHLDIVVCTIPYATGKMQRRKTCLFHTIKTKHKKTLQNYRVCSDQRNTNFRPFTWPQAETNANFYVKGPLCHITMTPLVDIQITAPCSQQKCISHHLKDISCTFFPSKVCTCSARTCL